ncbi:hypothetical protein GCM10022419_081150 [Nonomuraea rosea]|uniref:Xaa-Pro dipeptidyl-peptidase C-terminal domain-containing protein n=1 Tax=Nonomuraea rosea TaxID=638574 RepID=A0ABP6YPQ0_9ACTN
MFRSSWFCCHEEQELGGDAEAGAGRGRGPEHLRRQHGDLRLQVVTRGVLDAQNHKSLSRPTPLTPGKPYEITLKMLPQDYEFKAGHRLGLVRTGTNDDITDAEPGTGTKVTVDVAGTSVSLPLVAGASSGQ